MYSAYGQRTVTAGEGNSPLGYCARDGVLTEQTGLLYMRARYYSPELMRFINEDIIVGDISNSNSLNRYAYVEGNPVTMVDPFGLCAEKVKDFVTSLFAGVEYEVSKIYYDTLAGKLTDMLAAIGLSIKNDSNYFLTLYGMSDFNEQYRQETIVDKAVYQVPFNYGRLLTDFAALALSLKGLSLSESGIAFSVAGTGGSGGTASAITVPVGVVSVAGYVASVDIGIAAISNFISFFKEGVSVGGPKNDPSEGSINSNLLDELANSGVKYNPDDVITVMKNSEGKLMWLEKGNSKAGLTHILERHANDFASQGVSDIPQLLEDVLSTKPIKSGSNAKGLFADYMWNGNSYRVAYGTNGFVVSFYPID